MYHHRRNEDLEFQEKTCLLKADSQFYENNCGRNIEFQLRICTNSTVPWKVHTKYSLCMGHQKNLYFWDSLLFSENKAAGIQHIEIITYTYLLVIVWHSLYPYENIYAVAHRYWCSTSKGSVPSLSRNAR